MMNELRAGRTTMDLLGLDDRSQTFPALLLQDPAKRNASPTCPLPFGVPLTNLS